MRLVAINQGREEFVDGYTPLELEREGTDMVFLFDFSQFMKEAPEYLIYNEQKFARGPIEALDRRFVGHYAGARRYHQVF